MICTHVRVKEEGRGFNASNLGVWFCLRADPRKLKHEKVQNPTSAKIATLENFPLYGMIFLILINFNSITGTLKIIKP